MAVLVSGVVLDSVEVDSLVHLDTVVLDDVVVQHTFVVGLVLLAQVVLEINQLDYGLTVAIEAVTSPNVDAGAGAGVGPAYGRRLRRATCPAHLRRTGHAGGCAGACGSSAEQSWVGAGVESRVLLGVGLSAQALGICASIGLGVGASVKLGVGGKSGLGVGTSIGADVD